MSVPGTVPQFSDIPAARDQLGLGPLATVTSIQGGSVSNGVFTVSAVGSLPNGTSGAPALAFTSETTLGLYRLSAGVIGITGGLTAASATDLVLNGGSSGASLTLGQGSSGRATLAIGSDSRDALRLSRFGGTEYAQLSAFAGFTVIANKAASPAVYLQGTTDGTTYSTLASFDGVSPSIVGNLGVTGNLTVSGTGTSSFAGGLSVGSGVATPNITISGSGNSQLILNRAGNTNFSYVTTQTGGVQDWAFGSTGTTDSDFHIYSAGLSGDAFKLTRASGNGTLAGNLTANGGSIISSAGNGVESSVSLSQSGVAQWSFRNIATTGNLFLSVGGNDWLTVSRTTGDVVLTSGGLTVTGALKLGNSYAAGVTTATGTLDIKDSTGTTYHVLVHT